MTSFNISSAEVIFFTFKSLGKTRLDGPEIRVVFIPNLFSAMATSQPCLPLDSFEIYLTGSMYSLVGPVVTIAFQFFFLTMFLLLK